MNLDSRRTRSRRAFTLIETAAGAASAMTLLALTVPGLQHAACDADTQLSMRNLTRLAAAHDSYAADWNGRQYTLVRDDLDQANGQCDIYEQMFETHPSIELGVDCNGTEWAYRFDQNCNSFPLVKPFNFSGAADGTGAFRMIATKGFHDYVNGRHFDRTFYAPKDTAVLDAVAELLDDGCEYTPPGEFLLVQSSSYVLSPAAMFDPRVFERRHPDFTGGYSDPNDVPGGYASPAAHQATYAALKTRMIEHHWLQNPQEPCNSAFSGGYDGCQPYFFNHSTQSTPVAMFYDGSVRMLPVLEAYAADVRQRKQTNNLAGLWSRDTPYGVAGYYGPYGYDNVLTSFHLFTSDGILGRDTVAAP